jgi:hypothetical protein
MNLAARLKALRAVQTRLARLESQTLSALPKEYGFESMEAFVRAVRKATQLPLQSSRRIRWVRPDGTSQLRRDVAGLLAQRKSAIEIALKLGLSLRVVDRAMVSLESAEQLGVRRRNKRRGGMATKPARKRH